jgi:transposase InsO family protein
MLADFDPCVTGIAAQPFLLTGADASRIRRHVPDLLLAAADGGVMVVDVKAPSRMADPAVRAQFAWTRRVCAGRGRAFEAWSGADPRLLANVRFLAGYRRAALIDADLMVLAGLVSGSTPTRSAVLRKADARLDELHGAGVVPRPSPATAYRRLAELARGTNAVSGSAKGRRSIADRPPGAYGRLRAMRPGEYAILDAQDLDVFAMEPVTCRWMRAQLTVAQDLYTRCITGLRVTPVSTKAVDVAGVLFQAVVPRPAPEDWPEAACWAYHGVPQHLVFTEDGRLPGVPACPPETLVIDHGKAFLSAHVISVCARLGISIQPAQPKKPTDKPTLERFFKNLREGLIQHLPAYKGPDIYSRGEHVEDAAFLFIHELEDIIREWIALVFHRSRQDGLAVPEWLHLKLSPNEMYEAGVARAGLLRIPAIPELAYEFFEVHPRTIQHYGVEVGGLRYDGPALNPYRNTGSPFGGRYAGKWPIRVNPDDVRYAYFQDPADNSWHRLEWEHAPGLGTPFSGEAAGHARRLAARHDRWPDTGRALGELLARWDQGMVIGRRERRMAVRLAAERAALPDRPGMTWQAKSPICPAGSVRVRSRRPGKPVCGLSGEKPAMTTTLRRSSMLRRTATSTRTRSRSWDDRTALQPVAQGRLAPLCGGACAGAARAAAAGTAETAGRCGPGGVRRGPPRLARQLRDLAHSAAGCRARRAGGHRGRLAVRPGPGARRRGDRRAARAGQDHRRQQLRPQLRPRPDPPPRAADRPGPRADPGVPGRADLQHHAAHAEPDDLPVLRPSRRRPGPVPPSWPATPWTACCRARPGSGSSTTSASSTRAARTAWTSATTSSGWLTSCR